MNHPAPDPPRTLRSRFPLVLAIVISLYAALLRIDVIVDRYGTVDHPRWVRAVQRLSAVTRPFKPAAYEQLPVANPYVGGDPFSYVRHARDMRSFYQAHVREPIFLALTRGWLWLLGGQDVAVSFASTTGSATAVFGTYLLGAAACSPLVGLLAAGALAIDYEAVTWAADGWRDDTFTAAFVFSAWALVRLRRRPSGSNAILAGIIGAVACLTRLSALSFLVPALIWIPLSVEREMRGRALRASLSAAMLTLVLIAPYMINCARTFGDPFIAINAHTRYYRYAEGLPSERPESATRYLLGKFARRPLYEIDTAVEGLFIRPLTIKWSGYDAWLRGASRTLEILAIVGLALLAAFPEGRLLLLLCFTSLVPFAFTWNIGGGGEWRFTMHVYPIFLIAAFVAVTLAAHALRPARLRTIRIPRTIAASAAAAALAIVAIVELHRTLPYYVARETLGIGQAVNFMAGPRDEQFFREGWSDWHTDGVVTARVTVGDRSTLVVPLPGAAEYLLTFRIDPVRPQEPQTLTLLFNGTLLRTTPLEWNPQRVGAYRLTLPASYTRAGANTLVLVPARPIPARDADARYRWIDPDARIGCRVWYVRIEPIADAGRTNQR